MSYQIDALPEFYDIELQNHAVVLVTLLPLIYRVRGCVLFEHTHCQTTSPVVFELIDRWLCLTSLYIYKGVQTNNLNINA